MSERKQSGMIDSNGRVFGLISIIDVVVIFAIFALVGGVYLKTVVLEETGKTTRDVKIQASFEARIVPEYLAEALQIGDEIYDKDHESGGPIGVITNIEITEPRAIAELTDGTVSFVTSNSDINILVTIEGAGSVTDGRYSFNRIYELGINSARNFETKYAIFSAFVYDVQEID